MAVAKLAISLPKDIASLLDNQAATWEMSRSGTIARIIQEWQATRRSHLHLVDTTDRFPPLLDDNGIEPEAA
jgi:hypothetical protein